MSGIRGDPEGTTEGCVMLLSDALKQDGGKQADSHSSNPGAVWRVNTLDRRFGSSTHQEKNMLDILYILHGMLDHFLQILRFGEPGERSRARRTANAA